MAGNRQRTTSVVKPERDCKQKAEGFSFHAALPDEVTIDLSHWDEVYSFRQPAADLHEAAWFRQLTAAARRGRPYGETVWMKETAGRLGIEASLRGAGGRER